jgi:DNA topoisomerase-1
MTWNVPVKENCPVCGKTLFKLSGKGQRKPFCINEACSNFLPEDKRGYKKKTTGTKPDSKKAAAKPDGKTSGSGKTAKTTRRRTTKKAES